MRKSNNEKKQEVSFYADGKEYKMNAMDLALSNNLLLKALISELVRKKIIDQKQLSEVLANIERDYIKQK